MNVPMLDLKAQYEAIRDEVAGAIVAVIETHAYCNGPAVRTLEKEIAATCGVPWGVGVASGTDALLCALMALEIGPGDEVVTTPFTFFATAGVIWRVGARPVFADVEPDTFNIDPAAVAAAVTARTKAIIPVHLYGQTADMDPILATAAGRGLAVVEDAAQAIGATTKGRPAGSLGTCGCLSFYPTKNLGALGDAGMIVTADEALARKLEVFRLHGESSRYHHKYVGGNFRMDSIQAAALSVKLRHLDRWSDARRANAARYDALLADVTEVVTPTVRPENVSIFNQYVIRAPRRDELMARLKDRGIATGIYYPLSLHQQECFASLGYKTGDFPESERAAGEVLALPVHPDLTVAQVEYVAEQIAGFYGRRG